MDVEFEDEKLKRLFFDPSFTAGLHQDIVKAFRKRIQFIKQAVDERDFYEMKSLHYEKLRGSRQDERSMRLNDQFRLILKKREENDRTIMSVKAIEDYH